MLKIKSESAMENIWKRVMEDDIGVLLMLPQINQNRSEIVIISKLLEQGSLKPTTVLAICTYKSVWFIEAYCERCYDEGWYLSQ